MLVGQQGSQTHLCGDYSIKVPHSGEARVASHRTQKARSEGCSVLPLSHFTPRGWLDQAQFWV